MTHVYLPMTLSDVSAVLATGDVGPVPSIGYSVTAGLRAENPDESDEELEYAAQVRAAGASVARLIGDPGAPRRRVVLVVDVEEAAVADADGLETAAVEIVVSVPIRRVVSALVDDPAAEPTVARVVADPDDSDALSDLEDHQLLWFAAQELHELV